MIFFKNQKQLKRKKKNAFWKTLLLFFSHSFTTTSSWLQISSSELTNFWAAVHCVKFKSWIALSITDIPEGTRRGLWKITNERKRKVVVIMFWNLDFRIVLSQDISGFTHCYLQATSVDFISKTNIPHFEIILYFFFPYFHSSWFNSSYSNEQIIKFSLLSPDALFI